MKTFVKYVLLFICFAFGIAFAIGTIHAFIYPGYFNGAYDVEFLGTFAAIFLLGAVLLFRWKPTKGRGVEKTSQNPFRSIDPETFDKGEKINRRAEELRTLAIAGFSESEAVGALSSALGRETAAMLARHPSMTMEELLDPAFEGAREQAYRAADLKVEDAKELTDYQFKELANRIARAAARNTLPNDAIIATAKALALLIVFFARRDGRPPSEVLKFSQDAVSQFAQEARNEMDAQNVFPEGTVGRGR